MTKWSMDDVSLSTWNRWSRGRGFSILGGQDGTGTVGSLD